MIGEKERHVKVEEKGFSNNHKIPPKLNICMCYEPFHLFVSHSCSVACLFLSRKEIYSFTPFHCSVANVDANHMAAATTKMFVYMIIFTKHLFFSLELNSLMCPQISSFHIQYKCEPLCVHATS